MKLPLTKALFPSLFHLTGQNLCTETLDGVQEKEYTGIEEATEA
jgi:hypothetical protein